MKSLLLLLLGMGGVGAFFWGGQSKRAKSPIIGFPLITLALVALIVGCSGSSKFAGGSDGSGTPTDQEEPGDQEEPDAQEEPDDQSIVLPNGLIPSVSGIVQASRYTHANLIKLNWTSIEGSNEYLVYRYPSASDEDMPTIAYRGAVNYCEDPLKTSEPPQRNIPYYYKVLSIDGDGRAVQIGEDFIYGISGDTVDSSEPNDSETKASGLAIGQDPLPAFLYTLGKGRIEDRDFYSYTVDKMVFLRIQIALPNDSGLVGNAMVKVIDGPAPVLLKAGTTLVDFPTDKGGIFVVEFAAAGSEKDIVDSYTVSVSTL